MHEGEGMKMERKEDERVEKSLEKGEGAGQARCSGRLSSAYSSLSMFRPGFSASC